MLIAVVALSVPFLLRSLRTIASFDVTPEIVAPTTVRPVEVNPPRFHLVPDPLAILVLDLSGSMKTNDPEHDQAHAAATFLEVYRRMARSVTTDTAPAKVAVVLFSSIARIVSFGDQWWTDLQADDDATAVTALLRKVLGSAGEMETRQGAHTDHYAAALAVGNLVARYRAAGYQGSVGVVFMTDGEYDPHPLVDAALSSAQRTENDRQFWDWITSAAGRSRRAEVEQLHAAVRGWIEASNDPIDLRDDVAIEAIYPITTMSRELRSNVLSRTAMNALKTKLNNLRNSGVGGRTGLWFEEACDLSPTDVIRLVRLHAGDKVQGARSDDARVIELTDAKGLGPAFAGVLADWLDLERCEVTGPKSFRVQPGARELAVVVPAGHADTTSKVVCGDSNFPISDGLALIADPPPGICNLESSVRRPDAFIAFADSRYRWALALPRAFNMLDESVEMTLGLFRVDGSSGPEQARVADLYRGRPETMPADVSFPSGQTRNVTLNWDEEHGLYRGVLPQPDLPQPGEVGVAVQLSGLRFVNGQSDTDYELHEKTLLTEALDVGILYQRADGEVQAVGRVDGIRLQRGAYLECGPSCPWNIGGSP